MKAGMVIALIVSLTMITVGAIALAPPPRSDANCDSCHSSYYQRVEIADFSAPDNILKGGTNQSTMTVKVSASGTNAVRYAFSLTARIISVNSKVTVSSQQSNSGQCPSGSSAPFTWTKTYTFTLTGNVVGTDTLRAEAVMDPNHESPAVTQTSTRSATVYTVNNPPTLTSGSVSPTSGDTKTGFAFKVTYTDAEGTAPSYIRAVIDSTDRALHPTDGTADTIAMGEEYSIQGVVLGAGDHIFRFEASDGGATARSPLTGDLQGPTVVKSNSAPILSAGTVTPISGVPSQNYTYRVTYSDEDNDSPYGGVKLLIDGGAPIVMELDLLADVSLRDGDLSNGEMYAHTRNITEGAHNFSFEASDGKLGARIGPHLGPIVALVPVLYATIVEPLNDSEFFDDWEIGFSCDASTNRGVTDLQFRWYSNISGELSRSSEFDSILPLGRHEISLNVTSPSLKLSWEGSVSINICERPISKPPFSVISFYPAGDICINETYSVVFQVNYSVNEGSPSLVWYFDDGLASTSTFYDLVTNHSNSGDHAVKAVLLLNGTEAWSKTWNVTVLEVPAEIYLTDENWDVGGPFWSGNRIDIDIPAIDELGRDLTVEWTIDGIPVPIGGLNYSFKAGEKPFGTPGSHEGTVILTNPDGTHISVEFEYEVRYHDLGAGDEALPEDERREPGFGSFKDNEIGYVILIVCAIAVIGGIFKMAAAIVPEGAMKNLLPEPEEIPWEE